jgi:hypothetical protein
VPLIFACQCGEMMQETGLRLDSGRLFRLVDPGQGIEEEIVCGCGKSKWHIAHADMQDDCCEYCSNMSDD